MAKIKTKISNKIIAGKYKNKKILLPSLEVTRSTKSIVKESFFNVLQFDIIDTIFIEAFGGSGSIGLEALSRGAKEAYFIEKDPNSYKILEINCKNIDAQHSHLFLGDTFEILPNLVNNILNNKQDIIIYLDPPFDFRSGFNDIYQKTFNMIQNLNNDKIFLIAIEHKSGLNIPNNIGAFQLYKSKKFGKSSISYYQ
jgi:16S rRNA (guanine(966)-N(2))-methyltransferase RsmD